MITQELQFVRFYPKEASDDVWESVIDVQLVSFKENNPDDPPPPRELLRKRFEMFEEHPIFSPEVYLLRQLDEIIVAQVILAFPRPDSPEDEGQRHMGLMMPFVLPDYRRQGLASLMLEKVVTIFHGRGLTLIQAETDSDAGRAFAEKFGGSIGMEGRTSRLYTKDIDWELVQQWHDDCIQANPDVTIEMFEGLPDEADIEVYAQLYTEVFNQQPFEDLEGLEMSYTPERLREMHEQAQEQGSINIVRITREADGTISGLTEIGYNPHRPHRVGQGLTGVQAQYRGRGLGKWLKADMLLFIREQYPDAEFINTGNATVNAPMLSINERLGFKLYKHETMYKLQIADAMKHFDLS